MLVRFCRWWDRNELAILWVLLQVILGVALAAVVLHLGAV